MESHPTFTQYTLGQTLDLGGKIHYFAEGVWFRLGSSITGTGTIVVGNGGMARFDMLGLDQTMNVIALHGDGTAGTAQIVFNGVTTLRGLVYCHGPISVLGALTLDGRVISCGPNASIRATAAVVARRAAMAHYVPGFEAFFFEAPARPLTVRGWQRL